MKRTIQPTLFSLNEPAADPVTAPPDQRARDFAVDPANDVVLEASAGTGKTRVLVERYARLIEAGVDPRHILALTFTRKAAAEMRERILGGLRDRAARGLFTRKQSQELRERSATIQVSTIDAFCFGLLREYPLEANVDPAFSIADETEMARFSGEALDLTLRSARSRLAADEPLRLLFARVKQPILQDALATLLDRRQVALPAVRSFVRRQGPVQSAQAIASAFVGRLDGLFTHAPDRSALFENQPEAPEFRWLAADLARLGSLDGENPARIQHLRRRLERYFLTKSGEPRKRLVSSIPRTAFASADSRRRHEKAMASFAPGVLAELERVERDVEGLLARGLLTVLTMAVREYEQLLEDHSLLDFAGMLDRAVALLERQEEFARSRLKLQSRYHHVLVDEFQDTSRQQWRLIELLVDAWGEGEGPSDAPTSIFIVGDRKQSIYRFRHAEVTLLDEAARKIGALRPGRVVRQAITTSFRAIPELLAFVNALATEMPGDPELAERFTYDERDRFPLASVAPGARRDGEPVLGIIAEPSVAQTAVATAEEVVRLLSATTVRDISGSRAIRPDDIAILFRARAGHQYFEDALESRGVRTYVYKGLGFFDAPEVQDLQALLRYLAQPDSDLRAAEFIRSRFVRMSDVGLARIAPFFAAALRPDDRDAPTAASAHLAEVVPTLNDIDRALLERARGSVVDWLSQADRARPSEIIDAVIRDSAYLFELRGRRLQQARENLKKVRSLVRRVENRGYATLSRLAVYFDTLRAGDESNAVIEAAGAVNLMTIHAAKGLEFPVVFVVNLQAPGRGRTGGVTVIERGPSGESEVAFSTTEACRLEERRDAEELRRLLYVAVTRARDRLYLAADLRPGASLARSSRSLAGLLPTGLANAFAAAAMKTDREVTWTSAAGEFAFSVCGISTEVMAAHPAVIPAAAPNDGPADLQHDVQDAMPVALIAPGRLAVPATAAEAVSTTPAAALSSVSPVRGDPLIGTVVHRLFARQLDPIDRGDLLEADVLRVLRPEEIVEIEDRAAFVQRAASMYRALLARADVAAWLRAGTCLFEVPFSFAPPDAPGVRIRGVIDCLVLAPDGSVTVLELKTGQPRAEHELQGAVYARAMAAALGVTHVAVRIVYAGESG